MEGNKVLLMGGTGTLSTAVRTKALEKGYDVAVMNRGIRKASIQNEVEQLKCDFTDLYDIERTFSNRNFDVVVDFLSRKKEDIDRVYPFFAKRCRQYIFISSACVYRRNPTDFPIIEASPKPNSDWLYNVQKYECERKLIELSGREESVYTIIRPYITYDDERIPLGLTPAYHFHRTIIERIRAGKPWVIWDEGRAITTITHTDDFAKALVALFLNQKAFNEDFHLTSGCQCSQKELINLIYNKLSVSPNIVSLKTDEIVNELPEFRGILLGDRALDAIFDNSKLLAAVPGLTFEISIEKGIERVLRYWNSSDNYDYDYRFDAKMDRLVSKKSRTTFLNYKNSTKDARSIYYCYRYLPLAIASRIIK